NKRIELDEAVTLLFVVAGHPRASREFIAGLCGRKELHAAADVNPGAENGVVDQNLVHHPLQQGGMAETFADINLVALPDVIKIFSCRIASPFARQRAKPFADFVRIRAHRLPLGPGRYFDEILEREQWWRRRQ